MAKLTLNDIASLANTLSAKSLLNENFAEIERALENTLSRDGSTPNQMAADIDMDSNDLLNVGSVDAFEYRVNGVPLSQYIAYADKRYELFDGTGVENTFKLEENPGSLGNMDVSISGVTQRNGTDFTFDGNDIIFTTPPPAGVSNILVRYDEALPTGVTNSTAVTFQQVGGSVAKLRDLQDKDRDLLSALDYRGVDPTGVTSSVSGINAAITIAHMLGKDVFLPAGNYLLDDSILLLGGVSLYGEHFEPYTSYATTGVLGLGTILHVTHTGAPAILVQKSGVGFRTSGSSIESLAMYWDHDVPGPGWTPTVYDYAIKVDRADDVTIRDVLMVNPYDGIIITGNVLEPAGRLNIDHVYGQPIHIGLNIDLSVDVTSVTRMHFWPFWSDNADVLSWMKANSSTFLLSARSDNTQLNGLFGYGYPIGVHVTSNAVGTTQRLLAQNIDFDDSARGIWIDGTADGSSGSFVNFNATANPATTSADMFIAEADGTDYTFVNLRLSNSQASSIQVTGNNGQYRFVNVWADGWNIALGGNAAFSIGANCTAAFENHRATAGNGAVVVGGPGTTYIDEWVTYVPTITTDAGTLTSTTINRARYKRFRNQTFLDVDVRVNTNGTGAMSFNLGIPFTATYQASLVATEYENTGTLCQARIAAGGNTMKCYTYNNAYPMGDSRSIQVSGYYN